MRGASEEHDHRACVAAAVTAAHALCEQRGARLTALRRRVLELVWEDHAPVGAYALLDRLRREGQPGGPPTVYRALDFLVEHGLVHRIESLNAYLGCARPGTPHAGQFLLCTACGGATELDNPLLAAAAAKGAAAAGFEVHDQTVELRGLCRRCRAEHPGAAGPD